MTQFGKVAVLIRAFFLHFYITLHYITRYLLSFQPTEVVVDFHQFHNIIEMDSY